MSLAGRNVFITGAAGASGVGVGVVMAVLEAGGLPIINDCDAGRLAAAKVRFPQAEVVRGDISRAEEVDAMMGEIAKKLGTIHYLVNNAGVGLHKAPHLCEEADFDTLVGVDFRGTWLMTRAWLRHVLGGSGSPVAGASVVNISSVHAQKTMPGYGLYAGAKGAVDSFTRGLAVHYGPLGIRCNGVAPGYVHSAQNEDLLRNWTDDPARWVEDLLKNHQASPLAIEPLDVGRVVAFLLSDASRAMTGQMLTVDGGNTSLLFPNDFV